MSAVLKDPVLLPMTAPHLDAVLAIETAAYEFPWSRGNFVDSLAAGHVAQMLCGARGELLGYLVALPGFEEMHLLNLTVAPAAQSRGHARGMLAWLVALCRRQDARQLWLEVRESNARARQVYQRFGFAGIGKRKGYYPAPQGCREDAVVMGLPITPANPEPPDALD